MCVGYTLMSSEHEKEVFLTLSGETGQNILLVSKFQYRFIDSRSRFSAELVITTTTQQLKNNATSKSSLN